MSKQAPRRGEVHWGDLEPVKGSEQGGFRPVLVISNNLMNQTAPIVIVVPISRNGEKVKAGPFNVPYQSSLLQVDQQAVQELAKMGFQYAGQNGVLLCNHARSISKDRLIKRVGTFLPNRKVLEQVEQAISHSYGLDGCDNCDFPLRPNGLICANCQKVHRSKCLGCGLVVDHKFSFCPHCGRVVPK